MRLAVGRERERRTERAERGERRAPGSVSCAFHGAPPLLPSSFPPLCTPSPPTPPPSSLPVAGRLPHPRTKTDGRVDAPATPPWRQHADAPPLLLPQCGCAGTVAFLLPLRWRPAQSSPPTVSSAAAAALRRHMGACQTGRGLPHSRAAACAAAKAAVILPPALPPTPYPAGPRIVGHTPAFLLARVVADRHPTAGVPVNAVQRGEADARSPPSPPREREA